jgi:prepilin-type N-terminal cleavage/methylation domain-containing protein
MNNNKGFSLIELIITALVLNILAGVAIVAYIGVQEKSRVASITRSASTAISDLQLWLDTSLSSNRALREVDTNLDGLINADDKTNGDLLEEGVANTYIDVRTNVLSEWSPWFDRPMWNQEGTPPNGTINLTQPAVNQLRIIATEKNGLILYEKVLNSN